MNKTKKNFLPLITILLFFIVLFVGVYLFKETRKLTVGQVTTDKKSIALEVAREKLELGGKSYAIQVSREQYLKIKSIVDKTNVFFKDADTLHPQIQIKTKNKILEDKINAKRIKINELLMIWDNNNKQSLETDQSMINQIKVALIYFESYVEQSKTIVLDLSTESSGLSNEQINSFRDVVSSSADEIAEIIITVNATEIAIKESNENNPDNAQAPITKPTETPSQTVNPTPDSEDATQNNNTVALPNTPQNDTNATSTTTSKATTSTETRVIYRPRIVDVDQTTIYQQNPAPYKDTGVDVDTSGQMAPIQDWPSK